jgi:Rrf2 family iron-responsive transcriptional regulator
VISVSRKTDYAVRILLHLACLGQEAQVSIATIARIRRMPVSFVRRLIAPLIASGLLTSIRGIRGGVRLGRPAADISLLDVIDVVEGGLALNHCLEVGHTCPLAGGCPVQVAWRGASQVLADHLAGIRLDSLAAGAPGHLDAHRSDSAAVPA